MPSTCQRHGALPASALEVGSAPVSAGLAACASALSSAHELKTFLLALYDELDFAPARVVLRLRSLQMSGGALTRTVLAREDEYAAEFHPVREFRQAIREALAGTGTEGIAAGAATGSEHTGIVATAIRRLRLSLKKDDGVGLTFILNAVVGGAATQRDVAGHTAIRAAMVSLAAHMDAAVIVERACALISDALLIDGMHTTAAAVSTVALLVAALSRHADNVDVACAACAALNNLSIAGHDNIAHVDRADGIVALVDAFKRHLHHAAVARCASSALYAIWRLGDLTDAVARAGGIAPLLEALSRHSTDMSIVGCASGALYALASDGHCLIAIARAGGITTLRTILCSLMDDVGAACYVIGTLHYLAGHSDFSAAIADDGGVHTLLAFLVRHVHDAALAECTCGVLGSLAASDEIRAAIEQGGGVAAVAAAVTTHVGNAGVAEHASSALRKLCCTDESRAAAADAIAPLVTAVLVHMVHADTVSAAAAALSSLASDRANAALIASADGIAALVAAITRHVAIGKVVAYAAAALFHLTRSDVAVAASAAGAMAPLVNALRVHCGDDFVVHMVVATLNGLANSATCVSAMTEAGAISVVVSTLSTFVTLPAAEFGVECCCRLLEKLSADETHRAAIARAGGAAALKASIAAHSDNESIVASSSRVLDNMSS